MLHGLVVGMGIDADIVDLLFAEADGFVKDARSGALCRNAMNRAVGLFIEPCALAGCDIIGLDAKLQNKGAIDLAICMADIELAAFDVLLQLLDGRVGVAPLGGIAGPRLIGECTASREASLLGGRGGSPAPSS